MPNAYIETTIPSYYVVRTSQNLLQASRQISTRLWWDRGCSGFTLFTSLETLEEAQEGEADMAQCRLSLLDQVTLLDITNEAGILANTLVCNGLIPQKSASDAIHIAVASVHQMDYLVTWNSNLKKAGGSGRLAQDVGLMRLATSPRSAKKARLGIPQTT